MALAVANANPPPEVGLPFRKLLGMMWARWEGVEEMDMELL